MFSSLGHRARFDACHRSGERALTADRLRPCLPSSPPRRCTSWPAASCPRPTSASAASAPCRPSRSCCASSSRSSGGRCCSASSAGSSRSTASGSRMPAAPVRRSRAPGRLTKEFLGHTRMSRLKVVAVAHWFTALAFLILFTTLVNAFFQLVQPDYRLPVIGHFPPFEWLVEVFAWAGLVGIVVLIGDPAEEPPALGGRGRRAALTLLRLELLAGVLRRGHDLLRHDLHPAAARRSSRPWCPGSSRETSLALHFPLTGWMAPLFSGVSLPRSGDLGLRRRDGQDPHLDGVDDHHRAPADDGRGLAPLPRLPQHLVQAATPSGRTALGAAKPLTIGGKPFDMEAIEELDEDDALGRRQGRGLHLEGPARLLHVHRVRPLPVAVPRLEHRQAAVAQAAHDGAARPRRRQGAVPDGPRRRTSGDAGEARWPTAGAGTAARATASEGSVIDWSAMALVGETGYTLDSPLSAYNPHGPDAVIDPDVLWSCTTCGACVEQCPVDIEHVDHIVDMRRYQMLIESAFPSELGGLFKNLEKQGQPVGHGAPGRGWTGPRTCRSRCHGGRAGRRGPARRWSTCSGSAAPGPSRTGKEDDARRGRAARTPPA